MLLKTIVSITTHVRNYTLGLFRSLLLGAAAVTLAGVVACSSDDNSTSSSSGGTSGTSGGTSGSSGKTDDQYKSDVTTGLQASITTQLTALHDAAIELQAAAPTTTGRGWDTTMDAAAITAMKTAWRKTRVAYEHVEGATAPLYPDSDSFIDARYDDFLAALTAQGGDQYLFDDQGVIGMHAIERILYSDTTPGFVVDYEKTLMGYKAAAFPATQQESDDFKNKLLVRLVNDTNTLLTSWTGNPITVADCYSGLISLMHEQTEKVNNASSGEEESRYSQLTLADLRANLEGSTTAYALFQPWIVSKTNSSDPTKDGPTIDAKIQAGFTALKTAYDAQAGDAIPQPPATWSAENPSADDLQSPFGKLYSITHQEADVTADGSVVFEMNLTADLLGFPRFAEE